MNSATRAGDEVGVKRTSSTIADHHRRFTDTCARKHSLLCLR
jgi:hypothetical protein